MPLPVDRQSYDDLGGDPWYKGGVGGSSPAGPGGLPIAAGLSAGGGGGIYGTGYSPDFTPYGVRKRPLNMAAFSGGAPTSGGSRFGPIDTRGLTGTSYAYGQGGSPAMSAGSIPSTARAFESPWIRRVIERAAAPGGVTPGGLPGWQGGVANPAEGPHSIEELLKQLQEGRGGPNTWNNLAQMLLAGGTLPGTTFSPYGTQAGMDARRNEGLRLGDALSRRADLAATQADLDPSQRSAGRFFSQIGVQGALADQYGRAVDESAAQYEDMLRSILSSRLGLSDQMSLAEFESMRRGRGQQKGGGGFEIGAPGVGSIGFKW